MCCWRRCVYFSRSTQRDEWWWVADSQPLRRALQIHLGLFAQVSAVRMGFGRESTFAELVRAIRDELRKISAISASRE
jgi:arthrofactin-type cyclic lipopeptide synthetase A